MNLHIFVTCCLKLAHEYFRGSPNPLEAMVSQCELYLDLERSDPEASLRQREREMRRRRRKKGGDDWKRRNSDGGGEGRYSLVGYLPPLDFPTGSASSQKTSGALPGKPGDDTDEPRANSGSDWPPSLLSEKYHDRHFRSPRNGFKNIYHLLQDIGK